MAKHTPGPWAVATKYGARGGIEYSGGYVAFTCMPRQIPDERAIGESWIEMRERTKAEREALALEEAANARLFAAAPDLLAALQACYTMIAEECADGAHTEQAKQARAAIAKATEVS